ncbi:hypothetical protein EVAR_39836_1 [Eumeta japonica]|uniref:Uncharacterized protein n=1 Tax=Eumeta variegata TaxID=151549 RepID=A0A4C1XBE2_EUMVA|nr:hypothetical protein EVAR_39836_1 [Eumeta japonica]
MSTKQTGYRRVTLPCVIVKPTQIHATQVWRRDKRHEYNVVVEGPADSAPSGRTGVTHNERTAYVNSKGSEYKRGGKRVEVEPPERLYGYASKSTIQRNVKGDEERIKHERASSEIENDSDTRSAEEQNQDDTKRSPHTRRVTGANVTTTGTVDYSKLMAAADYALYEVGNPEIWHTVRVQLFEKTTTPDGKTVWNDLTGGTPISIGSIQSKWKNEDLVIRYRQLEKVERKEFALPKSNLRLLVPVSTPSEKYFGKINENSDGDYIIVPAEDIVYLDGESNDKRSELKNNLSSTPAVTVENGTKELSQRRVVVRVERAVPAPWPARPALVRRGADRYLTVPHLKPHPVQLDLEARADDNYLVRVGASGSIAILVADCTRTARSIIMAHVINIGLAAASFRVVIRDCGFDTPNVSDKEEAEVAATPPELIPPRHTRRLQLELPFELPLEIKHCTVALVNNKDKAVAVREVSLKKGDRCFCVWHCECTCLGVDPKLTCYEMLNSRAAAAGLTVDSERLRQRSICYPSELAIDISYFIIVLLLSMILPGVMKAIMGLCSPAVARWGLDSVVKTPPNIDKYYEPWLKNRPVVRDKDGWPIHPDTKDRSVHTSNLCGGARAGRGPAGKRHLDYMTSPESS